MVLKVTLFSSCSCYTKLPLIVGLPVQTSPHHKNSRLSTKELHSKIHMGHSPTKKMRNKQTLVSRSKANKKIGLAFESSSAFSNWKSGSGSSGPWNETTLQQVSPNKTWWRTYLVNANMHWTILNLYLCTRKAGWRQELTWAKRRVCEVRQGKTTRHTQLGLLYSTRISSMINIDQPSHLSANTLLLYTPSIQGCQERMSFLS